MPSKRSIIVATGVFVVFAIGFGWHTFQSACDTEASLVERTQNIAVLETSVRRAQEKIAVRQQEIAALQAKFRSTSAVNGAPITVATNILSPVKDQQTLMASDPDLHELGLRFNRANWAHMYGPMYQTLGLTQAQVDKFEELWTAHVDDMVNMWAAATAEGFKTKVPKEQLDSGLAALMKQIDDKYYATVASDVGAEVGAALSQEPRILDVQMTIVSAIDGVIPPGSPPLTNLQAAQLTKILANSSPSYQSGGVANLNDINWDDAYSQAAALLSVPQLLALKAEGELQQLSNKLKQFYSKEQPAGSP